VRFYVPEGTFREDDRKKIPLKEKVISQKKKGFDHEKCPQEGSMVRWGTFNDRIQRNAPKQQGDLFLLREKKIGLTDERRVQEVKIGVSADTLFVQRNVRREERRGISP